MKKYFIFSLSFIALFALIQIGSGLILTWMYTPEPNTGAAFTEEVLIVGQEPLLSSFMIAFLAATIAFFIAKKSNKQQTNN